MIIYDNIESIWYLLNLFSGPIPLLVLPAGFCHLQTSDWSERSILLQAAVCCACVHWSRRKELWDLLTITQQSHVSLSLEEKVFELQILNPCWLLQWHHWNRPRGRSGLPASFASRKCCLLAGTSLQGWGWRLSVKASNLTLHSIKSSLPVTVSLRLEKNQWPSANYG